MMHTTNGGQEGVDKSKWAVILAGGDGTRLKSLTRRISGDERPKQFCGILAGKTLLEQTRQRVALTVAPERTMFVVNRVHQPFYAPLLSDAATANLVVQPANRGTTPAVLYTLLRIAAIDPAALVAFFPSDHYISDDEGFMDHIVAAFEAVRFDKERIVLLGIHPESAEVEYGWIEPADPILAAGWPRLFGVRRFWEKPRYSIAKVLQLRGCLWNSFVMVASVQALLEVIESAVPDLCDAFAPARMTIRTRKEAKTIENIYQNLTEANFSHQVLAACPGRLAVLKVTGVRWNDLGEPRRVMASLSLAGLRPHWAESAVVQSV